MTYIQRVWEALEAGLWRFIRLIHNANHDYPYHDYTEILNSSESDYINGSYAVGTSNVDAHGDQTKRFVSKRANIWCGDNATFIRFNDSRNVAIFLPPRVYGGTDGKYGYEKEFHTNITVVYYTIAPLDTLHLYFEGVLPEEARDAE